ncbi:MAG: hypothetical protein ACTHKV_08550 [Flavipsychrobacter sp.]
MTLRERLIQFLSSKNLSQAKFEKQVGLSNGFVNNIGEGISTQSLIKILQAYPDLNATWLLTQSGEMVLGEGFELGEAPSEYGKKAGSNEPADLLTQIEEHANKILLSLQELRQAPGDVFQRGTNVVPGSVQKASTLDKKKTSRKLKDS